MLPIGHKKGKAEVSAFIAGIINTGNLLAANLAPSPQFDMARIGTLAGANAALAAIKGISGNLAVSSIGALSDPISIVRQINVAWPLRICQTYQAGTLRDLHAAT